MSELRWFRMYAEAVDNVKLKLVAFEDRWHYVAICCLQCIGMLDDDLDPNMQRKISLKLGLQAPELAELKRRLIEVDLIDETWKPVGWNERQFASDKSTARVRKFRSKQKKSNGKKKRSGNVSETPDSDSVSVSVSESLRGGVGEEIQTSNLDPKAWARWVEYRKEIGKPLKKVSLTAAKRALALYPDQAAVVEQSIANGWQGLFALREPRPGTKSVDPYYEEIRRAVANAHDA